MAETSPRSLSAADARLIEILYNALPDAVILLELSSGRILHWNNAATAIFKLPAEEARDRKLDFIFPDRESFQFFATDLASALRNHGSWQTKQEVFRHDGAKIHADITATLVRPRRFHGDYVVLAFRELARASDTDPATSTRYQDIIADFGRRTLGDEEIDSLMDGACTAVAEALQADYSEVLELLPGGKELLLRGGVGWEHERRGEIKIEAVAGSQESYTLASEKPVILEDIRRETRFGGTVLLRGREIGSGISVLLRGRPTPYGILSAHTVRQRTFTRDDT